MPLLKNFYGFPLLQCKVRKRFLLLLLLICSVLAPQCLEQHLAHNACSENIHQINKEGRNSPLHSMFPSASLVFFLSNFIFFILTKSFLSHIAYSKNKYNGKYRKNKSCKINKSLEPCFILNTSRSNSFFHYISSQVIPLYQTNSSCCHHLHLFPVAAITHYSNWWFKTTETHSFIGLRPEVWNQVAGSAAHPLGF